MRTIDMPHEVKSSSWNHLVYGNLLDAFLSTSHELLWAIDTNKRIILANEAYKQFILELTGEHIHIDDPVLPTVRNTEMTSRWDSFYTRALHGEKFNIITNYISDRKSVMIDTNFIPIIYSDHIMGTACIARSSKPKYSTENLLGTMIID